MFPRVPVLLVPLFLLTQSRAAESSGDVFIDPANAGPDFAFQGEYVGQGSAAQVIAEGDGKFRIVGFTPGLPGSSSEVEKKVEGPAQREGNKVVFDSDGWQGEIVDGVLTGKNRDGNTYRLTKTERKSPTLGAKPPEGAVVLFDGKSADQWEGGKLTPEGFLAMGVKSKQPFQSGKLHIEFRTPFMPKARGQGRGNSGVYLQDRYEVQVLDSFGLKGENNECGGIYSIAKPKVNMAFPPLSWQTYDIDFEAAEYDAAGTKTKPAFITVRHNGVLIHDRVEVSRGTTAAGRKEGADSGPIQLQNHGNPVVYRNIWFVPKS
jgi:hypothetical protein